MDKLKIGGTAAIMDGERLSHLLSFMVDIIDKGLTFPTIANSSDNFRRIYMT